MISDLLNLFSMHWPIVEQAVEPYNVSETSDAYCVIIRNTCDWFKCHRGCTMCNYTDRTGIHATTILEANADRIIEDLACIRNKHDRLKLYINGSFFNENELEYHVCLSFIERLRDELGITKLCVETRPEYVTSTILKKYIQDTHVDFELSFGLETTDDVIRNQCLHKGISYQQFLDVYNKIKEICAVRVYLLVKPPFITERHAIEDVVASVESLVEKGITNIIYTPVAVQSNTLLEFLLQENLYRPVWIWSLIEINSRLSHITEKYPGIHMGGLDYYPAPLQRMFNCENCSDLILRLLSDNRALTWDDFNYRCQCYDTWKTLIDNETNAGIAEEITHAEAVLRANLKRSEAIRRTSGSAECGLMLRDIAKMTPYETTVIDNVGIEGVCIPIVIDGYMTSFGNCTYSIELDPFHRGIHMSRLIECLNEFSRVTHNDFLEDMAHLLLQNGVSTYAKIDFEVIDTSTKVITNSTNYTRYGITCTVSSSKDNTVDKSITISVPFINACPCTKETVQALYNTSFTHTQRGSICITFRNSDISFNSALVVASKYTGIYDLLKREDEIHVVRNAYEEALFCEDVCRKIVRELKANPLTSSGSISVRVVTEESIHPHNAFAEKTIG